ncbi:hypothetical protein CLAIMM_15188, partial [Cladophialophora immunda]
CLTGEGGARPEYSAISGEDASHLIHSSSTSTYGMRGRERDFHSLEDRTVPVAVSSAVQDLYLETLKDAPPHAMVSTERTIKGALDRARDIGQLHGTQILISGSLHLASGALCLLVDDDDGSLS